MTFSALSNRTISHGCSLESNVAHSRTRACRTTLRRRHTSASPAKCSIPMCASRRLAYTSKRGTHLRNGINWVIMRTNPFYRWIVKKDDKTTRKFSTVRWALSTEALALVPHTSPNYGLTTHDSCFDVLISRLKRSTISPHNITFQKHEPVLGFVISEFWAFWVRARHVGSAYIGCNTTTTTARRQSSYISQLIMRSRNETLLDALQHVLCALNLLLKPIIVKPMWMNRIDAGVPGWFHLSWYHSGASDLPKIGLGPKSSSKT